MIVSNINDIDGRIVNHPDAKGALMKVLVSPTEGWEGYVMRALEVEVGGFTPKHAHPWPHINYMISGEGELLINGEYKKVKAGSFAFVPSNMMHQFRNAGNEPFKFICIVPEEGHK